MIGVSLPFDYLLNKDGIYGNADNLLCELKDLGVQSIEIRSVHTGTDPAEVRKIIDYLSGYGFNITVHGHVSSPETAADDIFKPLGLTDIPFRKELIITVHPVTGDNVKMLKILSDYIRENELHVRIALENNRLLPDKTEGDCISFVSDIISETDRPEIGICFDMGHYEWNSGNKNEIPWEFKKNIIHTHIHAVYEGKTHFPLDCRLSLEEYISSMRHSYYGVYNIELDPARFSDRLNPPEALKKSIRILSSVLPFYTKLYDEIRNSFTDRTVKAFNAISSAEKDTFTLVQSTSYLFSYSGMKISMDFALRDAAFLSDFTDKIENCFSGFGLHIITHDHEDHFDPVTVKHMINLPLKWIIPFFMTEKALECGIAADRIITAYPGKTIHEDSVTIIPFESRHYRPGTRNGVDELGYLITADDSPSMLFTGDVRDYSPLELPVHTDIDYMFAHVWLSDSNEDPSVCRKYAESQAEFISGFSPHNVIFAHLYESGRTDSQMWRKQHAEMVADKLENTVCIIPEPGESIVLEKTDRKG